MLPRASIFSVIRQFKNKAIFRRLFESESEMFKLFLILKVLENLGLNFYFYSHLDADVLDNPFIFIFLIRKYFTVLYKYYI